MKKLVIYILLLLIFFGCSSKGNEISVQTLKPNSINETNYILENNKVISGQSEYDIANNNYELVSKGKDNDKVDPIFDYIGSNVNNGDEYYYSYGLTKSVDKDGYGGNGRADITLYRKSNGKYKIIYKLKDVITFIADFKVYQDTIYFNHEIDGKAGLLKLRDGKLIHLLKSDDGLVNFAIDDNNGHVYTLESTDTLSTFREFDNNSKELNTLKFNSEFPLVGLYINKDEVSLISHQTNEMIENNEQVQETKSEYKVESYKKREVFDKLKNQEGNIVSIKDFSNDGVGMFSKTKNFINIYGMVCDLEFTKCYRYESVELLDDSDYVLLINDNNVLLSKIGSEKADILLDNSNSFLYRKIGNSLYLKVYKAPNSTEYKIIKYNLK